MDDRKAELAKYDEEHRKYIAELTNTRIRKLAVETGIYDCITDPYDALKNGDEYSSVMPDLERFAKLIIKECITILDSNNPLPPGAQVIYSLDQDEYFDKGWQVATETKSHQIKKHFQIED